MGSTETEQIVLDKDAQAAVDSAELLPATYARCVVLDARDYEHAGKALKDIKARGKALEVLRRSMTMPLDESKRRIMNFFRKPADALKKTESLIKGAMLTFSSEQERIRQAEENRLREVQQKEAERLESLAEKARVRAEEAEAEGNAAKAIEAANKAEEFERRQEAVETTQVSVAPVEAPKVRGVSTREVWTFEIEDAAKIPREYLIPDTKLIGDTARATKGKVPIPGVRIYSHKTIAAGGR